MTTNLDPGTGALSEPQLNGWGVVQQVPVPERPLDRLGIVSLFVAECPNCWRQREKAIGGPPRVF
jgi:hypothetical protein